MLAVIDGERELVSAELDSWIYRASMSLASSPKQAAQRALLEIGPCT